MKVLLKIILKRCLPENVDDLPLVAGCSPNSIYFDFRWKIGFGLARYYQNPGSPERGKDTESVMIFSGEYGIGLSIFFTFFVSATKVCLTTVYERKQSRQFLKGQ